MKTNTKRRLSAYLLLGLGLFICFTLLFTMGVFSLGRVMPEIFDREDIEAVHAFPNDPPDNDDNNRSIVTAATGTTGLSTIAASHQGETLANTNANRQADSAWANRKWAHAVVKYTHNTTFSGNLLTAVQQGKVTNLKVDIRVTFRGQESGSNRQSSSYQGQVQTFTMVGSTATSDNTRSSSKNGSSDNIANNANEETHTVFNKAPTATLTGLRFEFWSYKRTETNNSVFVAGNTGRTANAWLQVHQVTYTWTYRNVAYTFSPTVGGAVSSTSQNVAVTGNGSAVTANPQEGYYFSNWSSTIAGYNNIVTRTITPTVATELTHNNTTVTVNANFVALTWVNGTGANISYTYNGTARAPYAQKPAGNFTIKHFYWALTATTSWAWTANSKRESTLENPSAIMPTQAGTYYYSAEIGHSSHPGVVYGTTRAVEIIIGKETPATDIMPELIIQFGQEFPDFARGDYRFVATANRTIIIPGELAWISKPSAPNAHARRDYAVRFTPDDTNNFNTITATIYGTVDRATPIRMKDEEGLFFRGTIDFGQNKSNLASWLQYRNPHNSAVVIGAYNDGGLATYPQVSLLGGSVVNGQGNYTFTPNDTGNYNPVSIVPYEYMVNPVSPNITGVSAPAIFYGSRLPLVTATAYNPYHVGSPDWLLTVEYGWIGVSRMVFAPGTNNSQLIPQVSSSGTYDASYLVTGTAPSNSHGNENYKSGRVNATLTVNRTTPERTGLIDTTVSANAIFFEQPLSASVPIGTANNPHLSEYGATAGVWGSWVWDLDLISPSIGSPRILDIGMPRVNESGRHPVRFIPADNEWQNSANYTTDLTDTAQLTVNRISQEVFFGQGDRSFLSLNEGLASYNYSTNAEGNLYTTYETSSVPKTLTLQVLTTGLYSPRGIVGGEQVRTPLEIHFVSSGQATTASTVRIMRVEHIEIDGILYSLNTYNIIIAGVVNTGTLMLEFSQRDSNAGQLGTPTLPINTNADGNYNSFTLTTRFSLFIKNEQTVEGFEDTALTYGDPAYGFNNLDLSSGQINYTFTVISGNSVIEVMSNRNIRILSAGTAELRLQQAGLILESALTSAYLPVEKTITITVNPAPLTIEVIGASILYGEEFTTGEERFNLTGLVNNDNYETLVSWGLTTTYNSLTMRNVYGAYSIVPFGIEANENYAITYTGANLAISRATVIGTVSNHSISYGSQIPEIGILYEGFAYGEHFGHNDVRRNGEIVNAPTVSLQGYVRFSSVGLYAITISAVANSDNYIFNMASTAMLTVTTVAPVIEITPDFEEVIVEGVVIGERLNGAYVEIFGLTGGTAPEGIFTVEYSVFDINNPTNYDWKSDIPEEIGTYLIKVSYFATFGENYSDFEQIVGVSLNAFKPRFVYEAQSYVFTGLSIMPIVGIYEDPAFGDNTPKGHIELEFSTNNGETWTSDEPRNVGIYWIRVIYIPRETGDNYKQEEYDEFCLNGERMLFEITPSSGATIVLNGVSREYDGNQQTAGLARAYGIGSDSNIVIADNQNLFSFYYLNASGSWVSQAPTNAGRYRVRVVFLGLTGGNYSETESIFEDSWLIISRKTGILYESLNDSDIISVNAVYSNTPHGIGTIGALQGITGGSTPTGTLIVEYRLQGVQNPIGSVQPPVNAGVYDIIVRYVTIEGDNYASGTREFIGRVTITPAFVNSITAGAPIRASYTGFAHSVSRASVVVEAFGVRVENPDIRIEYCNGLGVNFSANAPVNAGTYSVKIIFLGSNNILGSEETLIGHIVIAKITPQFQVTRREYEAGTPVQLQLTDITVAGVRGQTPSGNISNIEYRLEGTSLWTVSPQAVSGNFDIRFKFEADEGNYLNVENSLHLSAITIRRLAPIISLVSTQTVEKVYNGLGEMPIGLEAYITNIPNNAEVRGSFVYTFSLRGANSFSANIPVNAGNYDVRVRYIANENGDIFTTSPIAFEFRNAVQILKAIVAVTPNAGFKIYDGSPIQGISFTNGALIGGGTTNRFTGSLTAGSTANVGLYAITIGSLRVEHRVGDSVYENYQIVLTQGVQYEIRKREVELSFPSVQTFIYDGLMKVISIEVRVRENGVLTSLPEQDLRVLTQYSQAGTAGFYEPINVGKFVATAVLIGNLSLNYSLPSVISQEYEILKAELEGVRLVGGGVRQYRGSAYQFILESDRVNLNADGVTISFNNPTSYTNVGIYSVIATINVPNYHELQLGASLTITRREYDILVFPETENLVFGEDFPELIYYTSLGETFTGLVEFKRGAGEIPTPGLREYAWTFTPTDIANNVPQTGSVWLNVRKAELPISNIVSDIVLDSKKVTSFNDIQNIILENHEELSKLGDLTIYILDSQGRTVKSFTYSSVTNAVNTSTGASSTNTQPADFWNLKPGNYTVHLMWAGTEYYESTGITISLSVPDNNNNALWYIVAGIAIAVLGIISGIVFAYKLRRRR
ncbi:MAG: hypothetical protein FWD49_00490 [Firmicutes bacterium]|nr:hypothetical protein [Bacillota bacterium]